MAAVTLPAAAATTTRAQTGGQATDGFYVRAGMVLDRPQDARFTDVNCADSSAAVLYGCGTGLDGAPLSTLGRFGTMAGYDLGVGYAVAPALRLEGSLQHRPSTAFEGHANFLQTAGMQAVSANVASLAGLLAAYVDLPALGLPRLGPFSPFVGGGIGLSRLAIEDMHMEFPRTTTIVPGGNHIDFTWMPAAGVAASLGDRVTIDVAWRYTAYGAVETGQGTARIVWRDGSRDPLEIDLAATAAELSSHGLWLSLRYAF